MINRRGGNECRPSDPKQSEAPHKKLEEEKQQQKLRAEYSTSPDDINRTSTRHALFANRRDHGYYRDGDVY